MANVLIGLVIGFALAVAWWAVWRMRRRRPAPAAPVQVHASIESMREVGELTVFRLVTKEIVTKADHAFGETGRRYLSWLISERKMAMIFEFGIDFKFDLHSSDFVIAPTGEGRYRLTLPRCEYTTNILDISFYDEQNARLLPILLPDLVNRLFGSGFDQQDKNDLKDAARAEADHMAQQMVERMQSDVQQSARQTLEALARGFGARQVTIEFQNTSPVLAQINLSDTAEAKITGAAG